MEDSRSPAQRCQDIRSCVLDAICWLTANETDKAMHNLRVADRGLLELVKALLLQEQETADNN
jgi:hypothetical protein